MWKPSLLQPLGWERHSLCKQKTSVQPLPAQFTRWGRARAFNLLNGVFFVPPEGSPGCSRVTGSGVGLWAVAPGPQGAEPAKSLLQADLQRSVFRGGGCFPAQLSPLLP